MGVAEVHSSNGGQSTGVFRKQFAALTMPPVPELFVDGRGHSRSSFCLGTLKDGTTMATSI
jgi:hypothetical protein